MDCSVLMDKNRSPMAIANTAQSVDQQQDEGGTRPSAGQTGHASAKGDAGRFAHGRALLVRRSRCDQAVAETETRMTNPTKNGDQ